jgi:hypothetical protein
MQLKDIDMLLKTASQYRIKRVRVIFQEAVEGLSIDTLNSERWLVLDGSGKTVGRFLTRAQAHLFKFSCILKQMQFKPS